MLKLKIKYVKRNTGIWGPFFFYSFFIFYIGVGVGIVLSSLEKHSLRKQNRRKGWAFWCRTVVVPVYTPIVSKVACLPCMYHHLSSTMTQFLELNDTARKVHSCEIHAPLHSVLLTAPAHCLLFVSSSAHAVCFSSAHISHKIITTPETIASQAMHLCWPHSYVSVASTPLWCQYLAQK